MSKPIHQAHDFQPNLNALLAAVVDQLEKTQRVEAGQVAITGTATGFAALDRMALGMQAGELIVVGARPGNGAYVLAPGGDERGDCALHREIPPGLRGACQISFSGKSFPLACYWGGGL